MGSANPARVEACRALGAEVVTAPDGKTAFEMVEAISRDEGRSFIHPFEGPYTAMGTATLGLEWLEQVPDLDAVIIAIGGGGLCGGASSAIKLLKPDCLVFGVEPTGSDTMTPQLRARVADRPCRGADDRRQPRAAFRAALQLRPVPGECRRDRARRRRRRSVPPWRSCSAT